MMPPMDGAEMEVPLTGGFVARGVVRVGDTVRRPLTDDSERIHRRPRSYAGGPEDPAARRG
jgi:hypothetical protein